MKVSIVLASFNGERFIGEQLESLAAQTVPPHELVVCDDGSTDSTLAIVRDFSERAPFTVTVVENVERLGYGANFLNGCTYASGDLIAFCDQDDIWCAEKLEVATRELQASNSVLFVHTAIAVDESGEELGEFSQGIRHASVHEPLELAPWGVFYGFSMVFRRELLLRVDPALRGKHTFEHTGLLSHDLWIYFLAHSTGRTRVVDIPLARYRRHDGNATPDILHRSFRALTSSLGRAAHKDLPRQEIASARATILDDLSARSDDAAERAALAVAAAYWRRIASLEGTRIQTYYGPTVAYRSAKFVQALAAGAYRPTSKGSLGRRLAVKDFLAGVLHARRRSS